MDIGLLQTQNILREKGILISFSGRFSQGIIVELGEAVKNYMENEKMSKTDIHKVFAVFIELSQNIKNYTTIKEGTDAHNIIANSSIANIGKSDDGYFIWAGNIIENVDLELLRENLNHLIKQDKNELKKLYKEQLKKEITLDRMGAGIGLIDIARKASLPIQYSMEKVDSKFSFYEILVRV